MHCASRRRGLGGRAARTRLQSAAGGVALIGLYRRYRYQRRIPRALSWACCRISSATTSRACGVGAPAAARRFFRRAPARRRLRGRRLPGPSPRTGRAPHLLNLGVYHRPSADEHVVHLPVVCVGGGRPDLLDDERRSLRPLTAMTDMPNTAPDHRPRPARGVTVGRPKPSNTGAAENPRVQLLDRRGHLFSVTVPAPYVPGGISASHSTTRAGYCSAIPLD